MFRSPILRQFSNRRFDFTAFRSPILRQFSNGRFDKLTGPCPVIGSLSPSKGPAPVMKSFFYSQHVNQVASGSKKFRPFRIAHLVFHKMAKAFLAHGVQLASHVVAGSVR